MSGELVGLLGIDGGIMREFASYLIPNVNICYDITNIDLIVKNVYIFLEFNFFFELTV